MTKFWIGPAVPKEANVPWAKSGTTQGARGEGDCMIMGKPTTSSRQTTPDKGIKDELVVQIAKVPHHDAAKVGMDKTKARTATTKEAKTYQRATTKVGANIAQSKTKLESPNQRPTGMNGELTREGGQTKFEVSKNWSPIKRELEKKPRSFSNGRR